MIIRIQELERVLLKYNFQALSEHPDINLQNNPSYPDEARLGRLPESGKEITLSIQKINNYLLSVAQTHSKDMGDGAGRPIYVIREKKIEYFRRYRESDRYSDASLKHLRIYKR
jgi:hypothetical protein